MKPKQKRLVAVLLMFSLVSALAIFFSALLGKAYLGILKSGETKVQPKAPAKTSPVIKREPVKSIELVPVPVFFLQGGIYTELEGARKAAEDFLAIGIDPYISGEPPYRIYIGFFGGREDAEKLKAYLAEKEISVFIQSVVLNPTALTYSKEKEALVNKWAPYLEQCSQALKDLEGRCSFGAFAQADQIQTIHNVEYLTRELAKLAGELEAALPEQGDFGEKAQRLDDSLLSVVDGMGKLQKEWNQHNYDMVAKTLTNFCQNYTECWNYLIEPEKT